MKNFDLGKKIKDLRNRKGISQEELAEKSQLSLRTVQRIENGENEARGDTLKRLAKVLNVTPDELIDWAEQEDKGFLAFLNLSALSFIFFPLLGIIVPMALWMLKKDKIKDLAETGKRLLNFQISWCIILFLIYFLLLSSELLHWNIIPKFKLIGGPEVIILTAVVWYFVNVLLIILNSIRSFNSKQVFYQPAFRFLR